MSEQEKILSEFDSAEKTWNEDVVGYCSTVLEIITYVRSHLTKSKTASISELADAEYTAACENLRILERITNDTIRTCENNLNKKG